MRCLAGRSLTIGQMSASNRPAAIIAADVAGYALLMGTDEQGTFGQLRGIRTDLIDPVLQPLTVEWSRRRATGLLAEFALAQAGRHFACPGACKKMPHETSISLS